jgi:hypothetical protein
MHVINPRFFRYSCIPFGRLHQHRGVLARFVDQKKAGPSLGPGSILGRLQDSNSCPITIIHGVSSEAVAKMYQQKYQQKSSLLWLEAGRLTKYPAGTFLCHLGAGQLRAYQPVDAVFEWITGTPPIVAGAEDTPIDPV